MSHLVKEVPLAGFLHTRLSGHLLGGGPTPAQVLALLEGEKKKKMSPRVILVCPEGLKTGIFFKHPAKDLATGLALQRMRILNSTLVNGP